MLLVAALLRLIGLGHPRTLVFDETYYVKDAWTLWHLGYEGSWGDKPDPGFAAGAVNGYSHAASYAAHPPLGKWIIGLFEVASGGAQDPFGWRLGVAVAGIVAVALLMLVTHRMFRTPLVTTVAGGLFAIENQAIVMSRVSLLDSLVMLLALAGFACVLEDRIRTERRLGRWMMDRRRGLGDWGPTFWWRPWVLAAGAAFGFCCGVKWSGIYFLAAFGLYVAGSDLLLRRRAGLRFWLPAGLLKQAPVLAVTALVPALVAYLVSWTGWFVTSGGYDRHALDGSADGRFTGALSWVPLPVQNLLVWHRSIYVFHTTLDAGHPYKAPAILWPIIARPTAMWWNGSAGSCGNGEADCVAAITDIPNPLIWYAGIAASIYLLVRFVRRREWQAGLILMGWVGGYLPWLLYPKRTMFFFYSIAFEPYLILALAATIGLLVMRPPEVDAADELVAAEASYGLRVRRGLVGAFLVLAVLVSAFYLPLSTGIPVPYWFWHAHMWSTTWV